MAKSGFGPKTSAAGLKPGAMGAAMADLLPGCRPAITPDLQVVTDGVLPDDAIAALARLLIDIEAVEPVDEIDVPVPADKPKLRRGRG